MGTLEYAYNDPYKPPYDPCYPAVEVVQQEHTAVPMAYMGAEKKPSWNFCVHGWSAFTMLCCCWCICFSSLFGLIGLLFSTAAYTDHKAEDYERSKYKKRCALGWMLTGLILALAVIAVAIYYGYTNRDLITGMINGYIAQIQQMITDLQTASAAASAAG